MPMALVFSPASRTILRPEPPSCPCNGCTCVTGAWKCCSKRWLRMFMKCVVVCAWGFTTKITPKSNARVEGHPQNKTSRKAESDSESRRCLLTFGAVPLQLPDHESGPEYDSGSS